MSIFDFLFKNKKTSQNDDTEKQLENVTPEIKEEYKGPISITETSYSVTREEKQNI
ncbi:hypothetical protein [Virgibacillus salexigens]|uniref:DUF4025 domain-containing protein n=1 Tax=Virgibacillus kapii TaxID=1638645 RepID=A0ABQ2E0M2_9BACI|nr:hypothetical protein [Virgibacillus kapii]GGJ76430.1 hypothetical protein GCM10007111_42540 [Virgibacillus kapii]